MLVRSAVQWHNRGFGWLETACSHIHPCAIPSSQPQDMHTMTRNIYPVNQGLPCSKFLIEIWNSNQSSPQFVTGCNPCFLSLPSGFPPLRKYRGWISGKRTNIEVAQDLSKVATTAETKCSTIWRGLFSASSSGITTCIECGSGHQCFRNDVTEDSKDQCPLLQNVC